MLSQVTRLLALVSAPPLGTSTVRHVEVLLLQAHTVMVVVITSTGGVTKRIFTFDAPVDPGLAAWAGEYLNERLNGVRLGSARLRGHLDDASLSTAERAFLATLWPALLDVAPADRRLYVGGTAEWLGEVPDQDLGVYRQLLATLEKRAALLEVIGQSLDPRRPFVRVGGELAHPAFQDVALVGATYGLTNQVLGSVSLLGPVRMDYEKAIQSVRDAAFELSRFVEEVYEDN